MTEAVDVPDWLDDNSMRFCIQMYPKFNSDGTENNKGQNSEHSERYRMRFFNKNLSLFDFHPQIAYPFDLVKVDDLDVKKNIDWNFRSSGDTSKLDYLDKLCSLEFNPLLADDKPYYVATDLKGVIDPKYTKHVTNNDTYGIAVTKQIINKADKIAMITFIRPIKAIHPQDLEIV
jgi:hypothetical protein